MKKEHIKDVDEMMSDEECVAPSQPTAQELQFKLERQSDLLEKKDEMISTLMESLRILYKKFIDEKERADYWKEECLKTENKEQEK